MDSVISIDIRPSGTQAKIAATATASAAISFTAGNIGKLAVTNRGTNGVYLRVGVVSTVLATVPGAAFGTAGVHIPPSSLPVILDISDLKADANGLLWLSAICEATESGTLIVASY